MQTQPHDPARERSFTNPTDPDVIEKKVTDVCPAIIMVLEPSKKKLLYFNNGLKDLLGYDPDQVRSVSAHPYNLFLSEDHPIIDFELDKHRRDGQYSSVLSIRVLDNKQRPRNAKMEISYLKQGEQKDCCVILMVQLIPPYSFPHDQATSAELLKEMENLLDFGAWTIEVNTGKMEWSDGLLKLLGYSTDDIPAEIDKELFLSHISPQDIEGFENSLELALNDSKPFQRVCTIISRDNIEKIVSVAVKPVQDSQKLSSILGVMKDITQETVLEMEQKELKGSLEGYREAMIEKERRLDFGSLELDLIENKLSWSDGMYRLFGYDPAEYKDKLHIDEEFYRMHMTESELTKAKVELKEAIQSRHNYIIETSIQSRDGKRKRLEIYGKVERRNGVPVKIVGITRDVTLVKDYEKNLQLKIEELDRSNKELEEFAYIASHDLQEPLRKITAFSERLQEKVTDVNPEAQLYLQRIQTATQNMRMLIDNLLQFSRTRRHNDGFSEVDLGESLRKAEAELELKFEETGSVIESASLPTITAISSQMVQLFTNLLSNAIKFRTPGEPVKIVITCDELSSSEKQSRMLSAEKEYYKITVKDNGIGFEQEYAVRIFQIFQRLHGKAEYPGSGIGLAICKKIIENHNGIIYAESAPGKGATFTIILPKNQ